MATIVNLKQADKLYYNNTSNQIKKIIINGTTAYEMQSAMIYNLNVDDRSTSSNTHYYEITVSLQKGPDITVADWNKFAPRTKIISGKISFNVGTNINFTFSTSGSGSISGWGSSYYYKAATGDISRGLDIHAATLEIYFQVDSTQTKRTIYSKANAGTGSLVYDHQHTGQYPFYTNKVWYPMTTN